MIMVKRSVPVAKQHITFIAQLGFICWMNEQFNALIFITLDSIFLSTRLGRAKQATFPTVFFFQ